MIGKRINPDKDLEYLLGNTDSKGRDRTSEVVGGGNLMVIMHMLSLIHISEPTRP